MQISERKKLEEKLSFTNIEKTTQMNLDISNEKSPIGQKNQRNIRIQCKSETFIVDEKYNITFTAWNTADHSLIKPINATISIIVSCKKPTSLQIYLLEEDDSIYNHITAKLFHDRHIHVRNNEVYYFQAWAFDRFNKPFYNFSSINVTWTIKHSSETKFEAIKFFLIPFNKI